MLLFLRGGNPPAPPVEGGYRSLFAFWMGGAGIEPGVAPPVDVVDRSPDAWFKKQKRRYYRQLQDELDRQLEAEEQAIESRQEPAEVPEAVPEPPQAVGAFLGYQPAIQTVVAQVLSGRPVVSTDARVRRAALLAELDRIALEMAIREDDEVILMLLAHAD